MKLSVIVPAYNSGQHLSNCIDSILNQTYKDIEVLIIDDGSTDNSKSLALSFAQKDGRVRVFPISHGGVSVARNVGIENASGEFIAFVDSDDTIKPNMYEKLVAIQEQFHVDLVTSDLLINGETVKNNIDQNCIIDKQKIESFVLPSFTYENAIGTMAFTNKIFRKAIIQNNSIVFYEGFQYQEDLMFMINIYANVNSMYYLPEAFYEYTPRAGGLYSSYRTDGGRKFIMARKKMLELISKYKIKNINFSNFDNSFLYNISYYIYRTLDRMKNTKERKKIIFDILNDSTVVECCREIYNNGTSFDRRIAKAICSGKKAYAIFLIKLVHSGKAGKLQSIIARIKEKM